jgi:hypothetical protein
MGRMVPTIDSPQGDHSDETPAKIANKNIGSASHELPVIGKAMADNNPPIRHAILNSTQRFLEVGVTISYVPITTLDIGYHSDLRNRNNLMAYMGYR